MEGASETKMESKDPDDGPERSTKSAGFFDFALLVTLAPLRSG